jgi:DNA-binding PadR family transcriptional regulator
MKYLTRKEELLLLAILRLKDAASLVSIRELLNKSTGEDWTVGNVYVALDKMQKSGYLESSIGEPSSRRGGKAVKFYKLTPEGIKALDMSKKVHDFMWQAYNPEVQEE